MESTQGFKFYDLTFRCWASILLWPPPTTASSCFFSIRCKTLPDPPEQARTIKAFFHKEVLQEKPLETG